MPITPEQIKSLPDDELEKFVEAGRQEQKERAERKKQETIARIKELAGAVGVRIAIGGGRGRPVRAKPTNGNGDPPVRKRA